MGLKEDVEKIENRINETSFAMELYKDSLEKEKRNSTRWFVVWLLTFGALCIFMYLYFNLLNDIGVIETTTQEVMQDNENGDNNFIGNDGDIIYGKTEDKDN